MQATILGAGVTAPNFRLQSSQEQTVSLANYLGRAVILAFYPGDFSPVCSDQMSLYSAVLPEFRKLDAELIGISVDSVWCHAAFAEQRKLHFPLLADFEPKGEISKKYGAYRQQDGTSERALFVIDADGIIEWSYCSPVNVNPGADGILDALERMRHGRAVDAA
ncbi:MAG: redoxin domain-containing protein [Gemmatimonadaceae bacterium]